MSRVEQNRQLNELKREVQRLNERLRALELDVEPGGHISEGFERLEADNERIFRQLDQLSHQVNLVLARQEVMLEALTKISDLPDEEIE